MQATAAAAAAAGGGGGGAQEGHGNASRRRDRERLGASRSGRSQGAKYVQNRNSESIYIFLDAGLSTYMQHHNEMLSAVETRFVFNLHLGFSCSRTSPSQKARASDM